MRINSTNSFYNFNPTSNTNPLRKSNLTAFKGWHPEAHNKEKIRQIAEVLEYGSVKNIAVSGHCNPDGDSIGSCFAMAHLLNKKTKQPVDVYIFGTLSKRFDYLKEGGDINVIEVNNENQLQKKNLKTYDLAVSLDTASTKLMDANYQNMIFDKAKYNLKIDHHKQSANIKDSSTYYADLILVDDSLPSASQLVMQLVEPLKLNPQDLPNQFNEAVYTGILTDSRSFSVTDSPMPFSDTALLIKNGLKPQEVYKNTFAKVPKKVMEVVTLAQKKVEYSKDNSIAYLYMDNSLTQAIENLKDKELEYEANGKIKDMVNNLRTIEGVEYALIFYKRGEEKMYVSGRSNRKNIRDLAVKHNGGGHERAAGFTVPIEVSPRVTIRKVLQEFKNNPKNVKKSDANFTCSQ